MQVLNQMGINAPIQANVVSQETSDANVVAKVALGQVDAGFVYLSDYVIDPTHLTLIKVPAWAQPKITYAMAIVTKSPNQAAAQAWVDKVLSPAGQAIFVKDGFLPLTAPVPTIAKVAPAHGEAGRDGDAHRHELQRHDLGHASRASRRSSRSSRATKLTLTVPAKAKTGTLTVTNPSGTATWKRVHGSASSAKRR